MRFGPDGSGQALYWLSYFPGSLHRVSFTGAANRSPNALATATPTDGPLPLDVSFDASASTDPDADPLSYEWDFGDGSDDVSGAQVTHAYTTAGTRFAKVTVTDGKGGSDVATVRIDAGNHAPVPTIESPALDDTFDVGQTITLHGSATDADDGPLPSSALTWEVVKHHATHTHPFLAPTTGNDLHILGPVPEDFSAVTNSYLEIKLTATDANGRSTTVTRNLRPHLVTLGLASSPTGLQMMVNGIQASTFTSWTGWKLAIDAPSQADATGQGQVFVSWSDGGTQEHQITTPLANTTYRASFTRNYVRPRGATPFRVPLVPAYAKCTSPNDTHGEPLAYGSCSPPTQASSYATVGTPDANGGFARSVGFVQFRAVQGKSSTPQDEADVKLRASISDVQDPTRSLQDYTGDLRAEIFLRVTDKQNGNSGTDTATLRDFRLNLMMTCTPTSGDGGSDCQANTTADALFPGFVREGKRAIWQLAAVNVFDGGADGRASTSPNSVFATQGFFIP